jgi:hypothetical protein
MYWQPRKVPVYRGYDITKNAFAEKYYVSGARVIYGSDGRFTTEQEARDFIDTLPDLTADRGDELVKQGPHQD